MIKKIYQILVMAYNLSHSQTLPITVGQILSTVYCIFNSILNWKCDHSVYYMTCMRLVKGMLHNVQFDQKQAVILCKDPSGKIVKDLMRSLLGSSDKSLQEVHIHVQSFTLWWTSIYNWWTVCFVQTVICNWQTIHFTWTFILAYILNAEYATRQLNINSLCFLMAVNTLKHQCKKWVNSLDLW